jgi:hypothetical protein
VRHRRAVAAEQTAGVGQRQSAHDVGEIQAAPGYAAQILLTDAEHLHHGLLDRLARDAEHTIVRRDIAAGGARGAIIGLQHRQKSE